jgi:hypothetical protein
MKKSGLFLIGMLVVVLVCGLLFTGCSNPFDKLFGGNNDSGGDDLSWQWSQGQWADWFNSHSPYESSDMNAVNNFRVENSLWVTNNSWWTTMYTDWIAGHYIDGSGGDSGLSTSWSQSQWQNWFDTHPYTDTSNLSAIQTFMAANPLWISNNPWWTTMYNNWGTGGGFDPSPSTSWSQSQWQNWFNSFPASSQYNIDIINTFKAANPLWISNNPWWTTMYNNWNTAGGGGGGDLSTSWSQTEWASWFNSHPYTNTSNLSAIQTFTSANSFWIAQHSWWTTMYGTWATGGSV